MIKVFFKCCCFLFFFCSIGVSATPILLSNPPINTNDQDSILRGAKFFATRCMMCHSLKYLTQDPIANAAGIDYNKMPIRAQQWWANSPPPDLTLEAAARGPAWIYTYLHSFYQDPSRPSGVNNLVFDNSNMPNPFGGLQGIQQLAVDKKQLATGNKRLRWFDALELTQQGSMSAEEFDRTTADLVNFLVYSSDPQRKHREILGWWILLYLILLAVLVYALKQSYWKKAK